MKKSLQRISAVIRKEVIRLIRDWHTLFLMLAIPMIELFLLAYSATITINHLPLIVFDQSHDVQSRAFLNSLTNLSYFDVVKTAGSQAELLRAIDAGEVKGGVIIPPDLAALVSRGEGKILMVLDGSDSYSLQSAYGAASAVTQNYAMELLVDSLQADGSLTHQTNLPVNTIVQTLYNPSRDDLIFIIPGIAVMILQMFAITGIATTIVREREYGMAEQLLSTPTRPMENIVGKMIPYLALTFIETIIIHALGVFWFQVPFKGAFFLYLVLVGLFQFSSLCVGLLVSTLARTQRQVQMISSLILVLSLLLTGIVFSRIPMPLWTKIVGDLVPATHFIPIARGIIVKGVGISGLWPNIGALSLFVFVLLPLLPVISRKRMD